MIDKLQKPFMFGNSHFGSALQSALGDVEPRNRAKGIARQSWPHGQPSASSRLDQCASSECPGIVASVACFFQTDCNIGAKAQPLFDPLAGGQWRAPAVKPVDYMAENRDSFNQSAYVREQANGAGGGTALRYYTIEYKL
jgi:hypothetical protein